MFEKQINNYINDMDNWYGEKPWKHIPYKGLPKKASADEFELFRWIGKQCHCQKWLLRMIRDRVRKQRKHNAR